MRIVAFARAAGIPEPRAAYWWPHVEQAMLAYGIVEPRQEAAFLAQVSHESARFTAVVESLNYNAGRLPQVFRVFRDGTADPFQYAHQPERIANLVYADRLGNGSVASGDGWRFRGRGLLQVTGRANYARVGEHLLLPLLEAPELLEQPEWAAMSAADFWVSVGADKVDDFDEITRLINGPAAMGQVDRLLAYERALEVLEAA